MRFSPDFIEKVRDANDLVDLIQQDSRLQGHGTRWMGLCPFPDHREKSPSFSVSQDKQVYHCFGCKKSGNIFTYLEQMRGMTFPEAVEYLASRASITLPVQSLQAHRASAPLRSQLHQVLESAAMFYHKTLLAMPEDSTVRAYMRMRGLSVESVSRFMLGYAPEGWETLAGFFRSQNLSLSHGIKLGLFKERTGKTGCYDAFRNRLLFPIRSVQGRFVGFGGRTLSEDEGPKYLNSPESEIFHKGKTLYGLFESSRYIRAEGEAILVEGYMDLVALSLAGLNYVVATLGTAFTEDHARLLKRQIDRVVVLFDGDEAGQEAAERSLVILLKAGLLPRALVLPEGLDPDDYLKKYGLSQLKELLTQAPDLFLVCLKRWLVNYKGQPSEKVALLNQVGPILNAAVDLRLKDLYIQQLAELLSVEEQWVKKVIQSEASAAAKIRPALEAPSSQPAAIASIEPEIQAEGSTVIDLRGAPRSELYLLNLALLKEAFFRKVKDAGVVAMLSHTGVQKMFVRADEEIGQMPNKFANLQASLLSVADPSESLCLTLKPPFLELTDEDLDRIVTDCIKRVRQDFLRGESKKLLSDLRMNTQKQPLHDLEQLMNIHRDRKSLDKTSKP